MDFMFRNYVYWESGEDYEFNSKSKINYWDNNIYLLVWYNRMIFERDIKEYNWYKDNIAKSNIKMNWIKSTFFF